MLGGVYLGCEAFEGVSRFYPDCGLVDNRSTVDLLGDPVDGAAGDFDSAAKGLTDAIETRKTGEEAGVKIDDLSGERPEKVRLQYAHESGQDDQVGLGGGDGLDEAGFTLAFELRFEGSGIDVPGWHLKAWTKREHCGVGTIAEQRDHPGAPQMSGLLGQKNRFGVGAAS